MSVRQEQTGLGLSNEGELACPSCSQSNLHHSRLDWFERDEDALEGFHAIIQETSVKVVTDLSDNPSNRRGGLVVTFWCEHCDSKPRLRLAQHKGSTFISMDWEP